MGVALARPGWMSDMCLQRTPRKVTPELQGRFTSENGYRESRLLAVTGAQEEPPDSNKDMFACEM